MQNETDMLLCSSADGQELNHLSLLSTAPDTIRPPSTAMMVPPCASTLILIAIWDDRWLPRLNWVNPYTNAATVRPHPREVKLFNHTQATRQQYNNPILKKQPNKLC